MAKKIISIFIDFNLNIINELMEQININPFSMILISKNAYYLEKIKMNKKIIIYPTNKLSNLKYINKIIEKKFIIHNITTNIYLKYNLNLLEFIKLEELFILKTYAPSKKNIYQMLFLICRNKKYKCQTTYIFFKHFINFIENIFINSNTIKYISLENILLKYKKKLYPYKTLNFLKTYKNINNNYNHIIKKNIYNKIIKL